MSSDDVRRILNERDIAILCKSCLTTLSRYGTSDKALPISKLYGMMGLNAFNLEIAMPVIFEDYLTPNKLVMIDNQRIKITNKGIQVSERIDEAGLSWRDIINAVKNRKDEAREQFDEFIGELLSEVHNIFRPRLFFSIVPNLESDLEVVLSNSGRSAGYNITCSFDPDLPYYGNITLAGLKVFKNLPFLERGQEVRFFFNYLPTVLNDNSIPKVTKVTVTYSDSNRKTYVDDYVIDLKQFSEILVTKAVKSTKSYQDELKEILKQVGFIRRKLEKD